MKLKTLTLLFACFLISKFSFSQEITMFPGFMGMKYYQDENRISKSEVEPILVKNKAAHDLWKKSKVHNGVALLAFGAELGFLFWQLDRGDSGKDQTGPFIGVLGSAAVAIGFSLSANNLRKNAILTFNKGFDTSYIQLGPTYNGLGVVWTFN